MKYNLKQITDACFNNCIVFIARKVVIKIDDSTRLLLNMGYIIETPSSFGVKIP